MPLFCHRLQSLPLALTHLNLKALWLAENQAQPMLRFQTEDDVLTGEKVLTCYLLPQQPPPSLGRCHLVGARPRGCTYPTQGCRCAQSRASLCSPTEDPLLQGSPSDSWNDAPVSRVSVIQFLEAPAGDEEPEEATEKQVGEGTDPQSLRARPPGSHPTLGHCPQGLQRRATPHPSELKVMKRGVEERRAEAPACRLGPRAPTPLEEVGAL